METTTAEWGLGSAVPPPSISISHVHPLSVKVRWEAIQAWQDGDKDAVVIWGHSPSQNPLGYTTEQKAGSSLAPSYIELYIELFNLLALLPFFLIIVFYDFTCRNTHALFLLSAPFYHLRSSFSVTVPLHSVRGRGSSTEHSAKLLTSSLRIQS